MGDVNPWLVVSQASKYLMNRTRERISSAQFTQHLQNAVNVRLSQILTDISDDKNELTESENAVLVECESAIRSLIAVQTE